MTEHLPECWAKDPSDPEAWCICDELRACAKRVLAGASEQDYANGKSHGLLDGYEDGYQEGYADALDSAREAVKAVNWFNDEGKMLSAVVATADSIAAIDALRGES